MKNMKITGLTTLGKNTCDMTSLSVDIQVKWGIIYEICEKLADILMFLSPLLRLTSFIQKKHATQRFKKRMQSTSFEKNIEYQTLYRSYFKNMGAHYAWILK